jgi:hypothetical protein
MKSFINNLISKLIIVTILLLTPIYVHSTTLQTLTQSDFNDGTYDNTHYNVSNSGLQLNNLQNYGNYTSKIYTSLGFSQWLNITIKTDAPYGQELIHNNKIETEINGIDMTGNTLLLHFNEDSTTITDYSINSNNATVNGAPTWISNGKFGGGFDFAGGNIVDYIDLDYRAADGLTDFTTSFWAKPESSAKGGIISGANPTHNNEFLFFMSYTALDIYLSDATDSWTINSNDGKWHHYTFTRSGSTGIVYKDGISLGPSTVSSDAIEVPTGGLMIGQEQDSVGGGFAASQAYNGKIDELAIWNRTFTQTEVTNLYKRGIINLNLSVKSCDDINCIGETWTELPQLNKNIINVENNTYFQYKTELTTQDSTYKPILHNVTINYNQLDTTPPNINLINPINNTINTSSNLPEFTFNVTDNFKIQSSCNLWMNETVLGTAQIKQTNSTVTNSINTIISPSAPLAENIYEWWIECDDESNTNISEKRIINISIDDTISPVVTSLTPTNNTINTTNTTPKFTYIVTDNKADFLSCDLWLDGGTLPTQTKFGNKLSDENTVETIISNTSLDNGNYSWWINCSDGNNNNISYTKNLEIFVDRTAPTVTLNLPSNNNNNVDLDTSINTFSCDINDDTNLFDVTLYLDIYNLWQPIETKLFSGTNQTATFNYGNPYTNYFIDRNYNWNCLAKDTTGKENFSENNFTFSNWNLGIYNDTIFNSTSNSLEISPTKLTGSYTSNIKKAIDKRKWENITIETLSKVGQQLPNNKEIEIKGIDMSSNVLLLHLDENPAISGTSMIDTSGNNNHGTLTTNDGGTNKSISDAIYSTGINLNSGGDYILANGVSSDIANSDFTVMFWAKMDSSSPQEFVLGINQNNGNNKFLLGHGSGNANLQLYDTNAWKNTGNTLTAGKWHLIGFTLDTINNLAEVYLDGESVLTFTSTTTIISTDSFAIGMEYDGSSPSDFWTGDIDEIGVWNTKLSDQTIKNMYHRGTSKINLSIKTCDDIYCIGDSWNNSYTNTYSELNIENSTYLQYKINLSRVNLNSNIKISEVKIGHSKSSEKDPIEIELITPNNSEKIFSESSVDFIWNVTYSGNNSLDCTIYINNISKFTQTCNINTTTTYNETLSPGTYTWNIEVTENITNKINSSYNTFKHFQNQNKKSTKSIELSGSNVYVINNKIKNKVNFSSDITVIEFIDYTMNHGIFNYIEDFTNLTIGTNYYGYLYGWEFTMTSDSSIEIVYPITKNTNYNKIKNNYIIGLE